MMNYISRLRYTCDVSAVYSSVLSTCICVFSHKTYTSCVYKTYDMSIALAQRLKHNNVIRFFQTKQVKYAVELLRYI